MSFVVIPKNMDDSEALQQEARRLFEGRAEIAQMRKRISYDIAPPWQGKGGIYWGRGTKHDEFMDGLKKLSAKTRGQDKSALLYYKHGRYSDAAHKIILSGINSQVLDETDKELVGLLKTYDCQIVDRKAAEVYSQK